MPGAAAPHLRLPISSFRLYISSRFIWGRSVGGRSWICFRYLKPGEEDNTASVPPYRLLVYARPFFCLCSLVCLTWEPVLWETMLGTGTPDPLSWRPGQSWARSATGQRSNCQHQGSEQVCRSPEATPDSPFHGPKQPVGLLSERHLHAMEPGHLRGDFCGQHRLSKLTGFQWPALHPGAYQGGEGAGAGGGRGGEWKWEGSQGFG